MSEVDEWFANLMATYDDHQEGITDAYQQLENAGVVSKVTVGKYLCVRGCVLATVIKVRGSIIARTRDYSLSPGANAARSVEAARLKNTLDGDHHWPGHTFDVSDLATWGTVAGIDMNCSHRLRTIPAVDIVTAVGDAAPGRPVKPIRI